MVQCNAAFKPSSTLNTGDTKTSAHKATNTATLAPRVSRNIANIGRTTPNRFPMQAANVSPTLAILNEADKTIITPNIARYTHLGPTFSTDPETKRWQQTSPGLREWTTLPDIINTLFAINRDQPHIELVCDHYLFGTLTPSNAVLDQIETLCADYPNRQVTITVHNRLYETPQQFSFNRPNDQPNFWATEQGNTLLGQVCRTHPFYQELLSAAETAHKSAPHATQGEWLKATLETLSQNNSATIDIPPSQRTAIFSYLDQAQTAIVDTVQANEQLCEALTTVDLYQHPLQAIAQQHPPNHSGDHCFYSIGGGALTSLLDFTRTLMDRGLLPLDCALLADNRSFEPIDEINQTGKRPSILNQLPINPERKKPIYLFNQSQRPDLLLHYKPGVIYLNVKVNSLPEILTPEFVSLMQEHDYCPCLVLPGKSYAEGQVPYTTIYHQINERYPALAEKLVVMGGFYAAPSILSGDCVDITIACKQLEPLKTLARALSATKLPPNELISQCDFINLELIPDQASAIAIMAGGANKNFLTYRSAHQLTDKLLSQPVLDEGALVTLDMQLEREKQQNSEISEEITARHVRAAHLLGADNKPISTLHFKSPHGLKEDFRNCLPPSIKGLMSVKQRLELLNWPNNPHARDSAKRLIESIRADKEKCLGTRNSRDGIIDAVITHLFKTQSEDTHYAHFYHEFYPAQWKGRHGQEGRHGIGPLIDFANEHELVLPQEVYEAWDLYNPEDPIEPPRHPAFAFPLSIHLSQFTHSISPNRNQVRYNSTLGLPQPWLSHVERVMHAPMSHTETIRQLNETLLDYPITWSRYEEITTRLQQITELSTEIELKLGAERKDSEENELKQTLNAEITTIKQALLTFAQAQTLETALSALRHCAQGLYKLNSIL